MTGFVFIESKTPFFVRLRRVLDIHYHINRMNNISTHFVGSFFADCLTFIHSPWGDQKFLSCDSILSSNHLSGFSGDESWPKTRLAWHRRGPWQPKSMKSLCSMQIISRNTLSRIHTRSIMWKNSTTSKSVLCRWWVCYRTFGGYQVPLFSRWPPLHIHLQSCSHLIVRTVKKHRFQ